MNADTDIISLTSRKYLKPQQPLIVVLLIIQNGGRISPLGNPQVSENCQARNSGHEILEKT